MIRARPSTIPADTVKSVVGQLKDKGQVTRGWIGVQIQPVNADIADIEIILVPEQDDFVNPVGVKGIGELGNVGTAAAVANAVYHATGRRVRELPITLDKLL